MEHTACFTSQLKRRIVPRQSQLQELEQGAYVNNSCDQKYILGTRFITSMENKPRLKGQMFLKGLYLANLKVTTCIGDLKLPPGLLPSITSSEHSATFETWLKNNRDDKITAILGKDRHSH